MATTNTITFEVIANSNIVSIEVPDFLLEEFRKTVVWPEMPHHVKIVSPQDPSKSITINFAA